MYLIVSLVLSWIKLHLISYVILPFNLKWSFPRLCIPSYLLFSLSVVSDSLQPHELQHTRLPYPSPSPRGCSNSCPLSRWCHPTISSSVVPLSSCPQSFPASGSFQMSQLFSSGGQSIGVSVSTSVPLMNTQEWSPFYPRQRMVYSMATLTMIPSN